MSLGRRATRSLPALLASLLAACGGDGGTTISPTAGPPAAVTVSLPAATLMMGDSARATATVRDAQGNVLSGAAVTWSSSAFNILEVNSSTGMVKGLALDTASVIATVGGTLRGAARVTVRPSMTATVTMLPATFLPFVALIGVGGTVTYDFTGPLDHNVIYVRKPGAPADIPPSRNVRVTRTFGTAGTFEYECRLHPGMTGEIIVVP